MCGVPLRGTVENGTNEEIVSAKDCSVKFGLDQMALIINVDIAATIIDERLPGGIPVPWPSLFCVSFTAVG